MVRRCDGSWWKVIGALAVAGVGLMVGLGAGGERTPAPDPGVLRVRRLDVVDANGRVVVRLRVNEDGAAEIVGVDGRDRALFRIGGSGDQRAMVLWNHDSGVMAGATADEVATRVSVQSLKDARGPVMGLLGARSSLLGIMGPDGRPVWAAPVQRGQR